MKIVGNAGRVYVIGNPSKVSRFYRGQATYLTGTRRALLCAVMIFLGSGWLAGQDLQSQGGTIQGVVKSGNIPLPGATVTAANTLTGQKVTTSTGVDGSYSLQIPADGHYVVRAQMAAFALVTQEVRITVTNRDAIMLQLTIRPVVGSSTPPSNIAVSRPAAPRAPCSWPLR